MQFSNRNLLNDIRKIIAYYHQVRRDLKVSIMPSVVKVNTGYKCNLKCPLCPTGRRESPVRKDLDIENFKIIIEKLNCVKKILLFGWGEPLLNKNIFDIIFLAKKHGKYVGMDSNLCTSDDSKLIQLVKSGLDLLSVSLDGVDKKTYASYRIGGDFELVMNNMEKIQRIKKKYKKERPVLEWQYCVNKFNENYVEIAKKKAKELKININIIPIGLYLAAINRPNEKEAFDWLPVYNIGLLKGQDPLAKTITQKKSCFELYHFPFIDTDCSVYFCCYAAVATKKNSLINDKITTCAGSLKEQDFFEIFNNHIYQYSRSLFSKQKINFKGVKTICDICRLYKKNNF